MMKKLFALVFLLLSATFAQAQNLELGLFGGASYYQGELNPGLPFVHAKPAYGLLGRYSKGTRWAYRAAVTHGSFYEDGKYARTAFIVPYTLQLVNQEITDLSLIVEFNFFDYFTGSKKEYITPYIFGGASLFLTSSAVKKSSDLPFSIPFGLGLKYSLGKRLGLSVEWKMHKSFHDTLEGFFLEDFQADVGDRDWYNFTGISLTYMFNLQKRQACNSYKDVAF